MAAFEPVEAKVAHLKEISCTIVQWNPASSTGIAVDRRGNKFRVCDTKAIEEIVVLVVGDPMEALIDRNSELEEAWNTVRGSLRNRQL